MVNILHEGDDKYKYSNINNNINNKWSNYNGYNYIWSAEIVLHCQTILFTLMWILIKLDALLYR